jgi:hypothetical protein
MSKVYHTKNAQKHPPWGAFDDEIIFHSRADSESFVMRKDEFNWLAHRLFEIWQRKQSPYIQILKEWNECIGFQDVDEQPSIIHDVSDTIAALRMVEPSTEQAFNVLEKEDLQQLIQFLEKHKDKQIEIIER